MNNVKKIEIKNTVILHNNIDKLTIKYYTNIIFNNYCINILKIKDYINDVELLNKCMNKLMDLLIKNQINTLIIKFKYNKNNKKY